jgi:hypothetical protein
MNFFVRFLNANIMHFDGIQLKFQIKIVPLTLRVRGGGEGLGRSALNNPQFFRTA